MVLCIQNIYLNLASFTNPQIALTLVILSGESENPEFGLPDLF